MEVSHDRTITVDDGDDISNVKIVNSDPNQPGIKCAAGAEHWSINNVVLEGGYGAVLRGAHAVASRMRLYGPARGIDIYETTAVPERISNDITVQEFLIEDSGSSSIHVQGPVFGVTVKDGVVRRAGQDGVTAYDHGGDMVRLVRVDVVGADNHGIHVGGHQAYVDNCTVKGVASGGPFCLFFGNHTNKPKMDIAYVGGGTFLNAEGATGALWARGVKRLVYGEWSSRMAMTTERIQDVDTISRRGQTMGRDG